nr:LytTR family DNA-binding domain-containing protein [uncultured Carboxylicivirga sp.]
MSESKLIKAIVVDDEPNNCLYLSKQLKKYCTQVEVCAMANNAAEGVQLIHQYQPDMVFLDIQMPGGNGFDLLESISERDFKVIFVTAYDQYAIKAIRYCAFDYLLKPINTIELQKAVDRVVAELKGHKKESILQYETLKHNGAHSAKRIALPSAQRLLFVEVSDIIRCEAESNYTSIYLQSGAKEVVSKTLKEYEELLAEEGFIRVHQSHLVNVQMIQSYEKADGGYLLMKDASQVPISRLRKEKVMEVLGG